MDTKRRRGRPADPERRKRREAELRRAALDLFLKHGLEQVTIDQITETAGHAKGSFYRHFANKEGLVERVYRPITEQLGTAFERLHQSIQSFSPGGDVRAAYELFATQASLVLLQDPRAAQLYLQERSGPATGSRKPIVETARRIEKEAVLATELAQRMGLLRPGDPLTIALVAVGTIERVLHAFLSGRITGQVTQVSEEVMRLILGGIAASR